MVGKIKLLIALLLLIFASVPLGASMAQAEPLHSETYTAFASASHTSGGDPLGTAETVTWLSLNTGPGPGYPTLRMIPPGTTVTLVDGHFEFWWMVEYDGTIGYVSGNYLTGINNPSDVEHKLIVVSLSQQWLYAYEHGVLVFHAPVSTGKPGWDTPPGEFRMFWKDPLMDMQGCAQGTCWYVPDVPYAMFITYGGVALHGTYWHNQFGTGARMSHGCINMTIEDARWLYYWAPLNTPVIVQP